jgi:hypothetical protein
MTALTAETFHFCDCDALDADVGDRLADIIKLERLDDRSNHFHCVPL